MGVASGFISSLIFVVVVFGTVVAAVTKWPAGTYGIPRAVSGCPSSAGFKWRTGWRYQDTEDFFPSNRRSSNFHLDASVDKNNLKRTFCMKTDKASDASRPGWPKGKYCIYKKGSCPSGLRSGYITWDDEDWLNKNNKGGVLPDGVYNSNTKIYYCCRTDGNKTEPVALPTNKPFFLVAYESAACQQVKWAQASSEWIRFDTEEDDDGYGGAYPYGAGMNDHTIHYCYYTSCNFTLTASSGSFQSPNYPNAYPAGQYCSWRIKVPEGLQVVLKFPSFTLERGTNTDNVQLYDGQNETSPSLGVYSGDKAPPPSGVQSSSNELFVILKTDSKNNFAGFQASYSAQRPTQPPSITIPTTKATTIPVKTTIKTTTASSTTGKQSTVKSVPTTAQTTQGLTTAQTTQGPTTAQTTQGPTTAQTTQGPTTAQKTQASTTGNTGSAIATTTARPSRGTTTYATTAGNTKNTETTTGHLTTQRVTLKSTISTTNTQTGNGSQASTPQATNEPSTRPTSEGIKDTTTGVETSNTGSTGIPMTEPTNEPTDMRSTENGHSTLEPLKNESSLGYRKMEPENGSSNVVLIVVPMMCVLLLGFCLLMVFLYRRRRQKRKEEQKCNQFVYYESNPKAESVDNPLYESAVTFSDDSTENPLYDVGKHAVNPLYDSKHEIKDLYEKQTAYKPAMSLKSHDLREYENPMYDSATSLDESFA